MAVCPGRTTAALLNSSIRQVETTSSRCQLGIPPYAECPAPLYRFIPFLVLQISLIFQPPFFSCLMLSSPWNAEQKDALFQQLYLAISSLTCPPSERFFSSTMHESVYINATMWAVSGEQISWAENVGLKLYYSKVRTLMTVDFAHIPSFILNVLRVMDSITMEIG